MNMVLWAICIFMITITTMIMIINVIMTMTRLDGIDWKIAPCRKIWKDRHVNRYWNNDTWQYMKSISILFGFPIHFLHRWGTQVHPQLHPRSAARGPLRNPLLAAPIPGWPRGGAVQPRKHGDLAGHLGHRLVIGGKSPILVAFPK